jgi:hypothetical protein
MDRKDIVSDVRGYENVVEVERSRENRGTYWGDWKSGPVSNDDRGRVCGRGGWKWESMPVVGVVW